MAVPEDTTADALRVRGNEAMLRGEWQVAVDLYSRAILAAPRDARCWCNRSQAYLKLGKPLLAWGDASHVVTVLEPMNVKALARTAAACQDMNHYETALRCYSRCFMLPLDAATRRDLEARARACIAAKTAYEVACAAQSATESTRRFVAGAFKGAAESISEEVKRESMAVDDYVHWMGVCRGGEGGPRAPASVLAAFAGKLSTDNVELKVSPDKQGLGIFATRDMPPGTLVHMETPLLAASLGADDCYHCLRPLPAPPTACASGCDRRYCSAACKRTAMVTYHEPLCGKALKEVEEFASTGMSASSRFILLMWKMLGAAMVRSKKTRTRLQSPADMPPFCHFFRRHDVDSADPREKEWVFSALYMLKVWTLLRRVIGMHDPMVAEPALSIAWVPEAAALIAPNAITVHGDGRVLLKNDALALMGVGNFFNHSCEPNAVDVSHTTDYGSHIMFVTSRAVRRGEEITISYCDKDAPVDDRRLMMEGQYGFVCNCPKCVAEDGEKM